MKPRNESDLAVLRQNRGVNIPLRPDLFTANVKAVTTMQTVAIHSKNKRFTKESSFIHVSQRNTGGKYRKIYTIWRTNL